MQNVKFVNRTETGIEILEIPTGCCPEGTITDADGYAVGNADGTDGANGLALEIGVGLVAIAAAAYGAHVLRKQHDERMKALKGHTLIIRTVSGISYIGGLDFAASDIGWNPGRLRSFFSRDKKSGQFRLLIKEQTLASVPVGEYISVAHSEVAFIAKMSAYDMASFKEGQARRVVVGALTDDAMAEVLKKHEQWVKEKYVLSGLDSAAPEARSMKELVQEDAEALIEKAKGVMPAFVSVSESASTAVKTAVRVLGEMLSGSAKPKAEEPKAEEPKAEEPKAEEPKAEEPKAEEPKAEEPKAATLDQTVVDIAASRIKKAEADAASRIKKAEAESAALLVRAELAEEAAKLARPRSASELGALTRAELQKLAASREISVARKAKKALLVAAILAGQAAPAVPVTASAKEG
jgi:hypothetical protein